MGTLTLSGDFTFTLQTIDWMPAGGGTGNATVMAATGAFSAPDTGTAKDLNTVPQPVGIPFLLADFLTFAGQADEFDLTLFQDLPLDHGLHSPLTMMWPASPDWPGAVIPLVVNVLQHPLPSPRRCFSLGKSLRKAILSYPESLKVAIVGTGGLSHQMIGERAGFNNEKWDLEFLELIDRDPERLARMSIEEFMELGGNEGAEVIMWLIMRGALAEGARKVHQSYYLPMTTAMAVALFE